MELMGVVVILLALGAFLIGRWARNNPLAPSDTTDPGLEAEWGKSIK